MQNLSCSEVPSSLTRLFFRCFLGTSAYGKSFGGGGWISRFGRPMISVSERRMTGTDVEARRAGWAFF